MQDVHTILPIGTLVQGRYRIDELLGKGGFGAVYRVHDQRVNGNTFALKEVVDPNQRERKLFTFEGEVLKRLDHPSLPRVYRTFEDEKAPRAYILMDYIQGSDLEELRKKQPDYRFSLAEAMRLLAPIVEAIDYLHKQQPPIVHRDVKPANIIVPPSGDNAVLVDFGIAKEYDIDATTSSMRICSPGYGAPEQYSAGTNPRTDIYGLGATFYALLAGKIPPDAVYRMTQMGSKHDDPLELVTVDVPDVPPYIADAIQKAMEIRSEDRFESIEAFWQALRQQDAGEVPELPVAERAVVPPPPAREETPLLTTSSIRVYALPPQRTGRRRILMLSLLALLALAIITVGVVSATQTIYMPSRTHNHLATPTGHAQQTPQATKNSSQATNVVGTAKATVTSAPTPSPITQATASPTPSPTTPPAVYPKLAVNYSGTISDKQTEPFTNSTMALTQIQQTDGAIKGHFTVGTGLVASDRFAGTVGTDQTITFIVPAYSYLAPLLFQGQIQPDGSMSGTYCSYRGNPQCDKGTGGWGDWHVTPSTAMRIASLF